MGYEWSVLMPAEDRDLPSDATDAVIARGGKVDQAALYELYEQSSDDDTPVSVRFELSRDLQKRLDRYLVDRIPFLSRTSLQRLIREQAVTVNGRPPKASTKLRKGDVVCAVLPPPPSNQITPQAIPLELIHEDDDLIVINKHDDIIVHPARSHMSGTMINGLAHHFQARSSGHLSSVGDEFARPGVVHRLDRHTTGVMVFAKSDTAHWRLGRQFEQRRVEKRYLAVVHGQVEPLADVIDIPLGKHPTIKEKYAVRWDPTGKPSVTIYRVRELYRDFSLVELELKTGRTHQIRVHLAHLGYPIVADDMYGGRRSGSDGQPLIDRPALHAARLGFTHPITQEPLVFEAPLPADMAKLVSDLRRDRFVDAPKVAGAEIDLEEATSHQPSAIRKKDSPRSNTENHGEDMVDP